MGSNPYFDELFNNTHKVPTTKQPVYDEVEDDEDLPDYDIFDDIDEE